MPLASPRRSPPQGPPSFDNLTPESLLAAVEITLAQSSALREKLVETLEPATATFENLIRPLINDHNTAGCVTGPLILLERVASNANLREAAREAHKRTDTANTRNLLRPDIAELVNAVYYYHLNKARMIDGGRGEEAPILNDEDQYLLNRLHMQFTISGANIKDEAKRARISVAKSEVDELIAAAQQDFTESSDRDGLWLTRSDLEGMPENWLSNLKNESNLKPNQAATPQYWVTFKESHYLPILRYATRESTRRQVYLAKTRRFPQNVGRLQRIVELRHEIAHIMGFTSYAELRMKERMACSMVDIQKELVELKLELLPLTLIEIEPLKQLKRKDTDAARGSGKAGEQGDLIPKGQTSTIDTVASYHTTGYHVWDRLYYDEKLKRESYAIDNRKLSQYFEVCHTVHGMLALYEKLFGLKFEKVEKPSIWHESVSLYSVWDSERERQGEFLGYLYLDIFGRRGKTQQQYHTAIQPTFTDSHGGRYYPVSALILPFQMPGQNRPSLLQHRDVKIMFHELGHAVHHLVDRTCYGISHSRDYAEIPSRLLEHLIWQPEVLVKLGMHYSVLSQYSQDEGFDKKVEMTEGKLPLSMAQDVYHTKLLGEAQGMITQLSSALFDLALYTTSTKGEKLHLDTTALWNNIKRAVLPYDRVDEEDLGFGQAEWSPAFRNTDAGYYTYVQSTAYAADLFASKFSANPFGKCADSSDEWKRWRRQVLERGSGQSELALLESFSGRKMSVKTAPRLIAASQKIDSSAKKAAHIPLNTTGVVSNKRSI